MNKFLFFIRNKLYLKLIETFFFINKIFIKIKIIYLYIFLKKILEIIFFLKKYLFIIFFVYLIKAFLFEFFYIPSNSMYPEIKNGDIVLVNKFLFNYKIKIFNKILNIKNIKKNDIIVFLCPFNNKIKYIKRISGVYGDKIFYKIKLDEINYIFFNNKHYICNLFNLSFNTENIDFYKKYNYKKFFQENDKNSKFLKFIIIPKNNYFVTGDNKDNSFDSRYWGILNKKYLIGKALYKIVNINFYSKDKFFKIYFNKIK